MCMKSFAENNSIYNNDHGHLSPDRRIPEPLLLCSDDDLLLVNLTTLGTARPGYQPTIDGKF